MGLFERFKQKLIVEEKGKKKKCPTEKEEDDKQKQVSQLTPREHDLYLLLIEGFTLKESAKELSIKYSTANTHMTGIYKKLGVKSRAELIINYRNININGGNCDDKSRK